MRLSLGAQYVGPARYLAQLIGASDEQVMRWFILVVALLLDPAAVMLLLAATARRLAPPNYHKFDLG